MEEFIATEPFFEPHVKTRTAAESYQRVLADVGCNRPAPDPVDLRIIEETRNGTFTYHRQPDDPADGNEDYNGDGHEP